MVQRVRGASVSVEGATVGRIGGGLLVFLGVQAGDGEADLVYIVRKILGLRVFPDGEGRMNRDITEAGGGILLISQFTLLGDARKGKRPSWDAAALPEDARALYEACLRGLAAGGVTVEGGTFQAHMEIDCLHDGPVTILLDSRKAF